MKMNRMLGFESPTESWSSPEEAAPPKDVRCWWDFEGVKTATHSLLESMQPMVDHWERLKWAPETAGGYEAISALRIALEQARPYIDAPFGEFKPALGQKAPKEWHSYALALYPMTGKILIDAGHRLPASISRNSVLVDLIYRALLRLEVPDAAMISTSGVAAYLDRWAIKSGLTTNHIASVCRLDSAGQQTAR